MIDKSAKAILKADVDALIASGRTEDRTIEYKSELPGPSDDQKREFLRDVSSFANATGGDILYGVDEQGGVATASPGVEVSDFDDLRLRFQNIIHSNLDPRLPIVDVVEIRGFDKGSVVLVRAYQSWRAPHMVTFKGLNKFYVRANGQRHEMDVTELRAAFVGSESVRERIRAFLDSRFTRILSGESAARAYDWPQLVIHVLPAGESFTSSELDPRRIDTSWMLLNKSSDLELVYSADAKPNLDGLLIYSPSYEQRTGGSPAYVQIFRNGGIEFVESQYGFDRQQQQEVAATSINGHNAEVRVLECVDNSRVFRRALGLAGAVMISVAFLRAKGLPFGTDQLFMRYGRSRTFDRDTVILPDIVLDEDADPHAVLRLILDAMWQAAGTKGSPNYSDDGSYHRPRVR